MQKRMLHVSFYFADGKSKNAIIGKVFDRALDWYRYSPNCWFLWTTTSADEWYKRVRPVIADADTVLIMGVDLTERQGWVSEDLWEWLDKDRTKP